MASLKETFSVMFRLIFFLSMLVIIRMDANPLLNSSSDHTDQGKRSITQLDQITYRHFLPNHRHNQQKQDIPVKSQRQLSLNISNQSSIDTQHLTSGVSNRLPLQPQVKQQRQNFNKLPHSLAVDVAEDGRYYRKHRPNTQIHRQIKHGSHQKRQRQQIKDFRLQVSKDGGNKWKTKELSLGFAKDKKTNNQLKNDIDIRGLENRPSVLVVTKMTNLKKEMCKSEPLAQRVREPGCRPKMVTNRFCYGQCNSFYIPKGGMKGVAMEASLDKTAFKSCSFCRPKKVDSVAITLFCPRLPQKFVRKHIQIIRHCTCSALSVK